MRTGLVHAWPSADVLNTMSFDVQPDRKRQSAQTTYTLPVLSTSTEGIGGSRMLPAIVCVDWFETSCVSPQLWPPFVERNA